MDAFARVFVANEKFGITSKTQTYMGSFFFNDRLLAIDNRENMNGRLTYIVYVYNLSRVCRR